MSWQVALKPGHSLMDWIRFAKSGKDLTGLRGRLIEVTSEELLKHNTRNDCWTCIRGLVYNITPYMDYHPGGEDELMRAAGIDGTELFDQVHRWVNYESMLKECLVGKMATKPVITNNGILTKHTSQKKYDWFQTDSTVHLVIYAKRKVKNKRSLNYINIDKLTGILCLCVSSVQTAFTVGKIQLTIRKQNTGKWASLGQALESHNTFLRKQDRAVFYRDCALVSKTDVNHNTHVYRLQLPPGTVMHVPVGKHVYLKTNIQDAEVVRPYTPVDRTLWTPPDSAQDPDLYLMVKVYPDGLFTPHLHSIHPGGSVSVSGPEGSFSLRPLRDVTHLFLVAAGTGFTPMARLIDTALRDVQTIRKTKLLFFNRTEEDILWRSELDELAATEERFEVEYILSEPRESWSGTTGRVNETLLRETVSKPDGSKCFACVCGPDAFTKLTMGLLKQQGFEEQELHAFQG
uniref:Cytochrome b5 reductase 4 n=1 Tax=Neogobius melanostomus TaxID=47308 RepID=A0A8C6S9L7_9GOBI